MLHIISPFTEKEIKVRRCHWAYHNVTRGRAYTHHRIKIPYRRGQGSIDEARAIYEELSKLPIAPHEDVAVFPYQGYNFGFTHSVVTYIHETFDGLVNVRVLNEHIPSPKEIRR